MRLNLNDPESIRKWLAENPERHKAQLRRFYRMWTSFQEAILEATKSAHSAEEPGTAPTDAQGGK